MFQRIGLIARPDGAAVRSALLALLQLLDRRGIAVTIDENSREHLRSDDLPCVPASDIAAGQDLVIAVGGDGTLLHAAQLVLPHNVPLTGINLGRLGFLTDLSPDQIDTDLDAILNGNFVTEQRIVMSCAAYRDDAQMVFAYAINDVVIQKWNTARLITFDTYIDRHFVHTQRSDGSIIATPTGSTAYALSGGGPIMHPGLAAVVLVPICPHSLGNRPLVVNDSVEIEMRMRTSRPGEAQLTCDGNDVCILAPGDQVRIRKHPTPVTLVHPARHDHFATLRAKLQWGVDL